MKRYRTQIILVLLIEIVFSGCEKKYDFFHFKSKWMKDYFEEIKSGNYPNIYAISWWHEDFDNTYLTINSSKHSKNTYQDLVNDDIFITSC